MPCGLCEKANSMMIANTTLRIMVLRKFKSRLAMANPPVGSSGLTITPFDAGEKRRGSRRFGARQRAPRRYNLSEEERRRMSNGFRIGCGAAAAMLAALLGGQTLAATYTLDATPTTVAWGNYDAAAKPVCTSPLATRWSSTPC